MPLQPEGARIQTPPEAGRSCQPDTILTSKRRYTRRPGLSKLGGLGSAAPEIAEPDQWFCPARLSGENRHVTSNFNLRQFAFCHQPGLPRSVRSEGEASDPKTAFGFCASSSFPAEVWGPGTGWWVESRYPSRPSLARSVHPGQAVRVRAEDTLRSMARWRAGTQNPLFQQTHITPHGADRPIGRQTALVVPRAVLRPKSGGRGRVGGWKAGIHRAPRWRVMDTPVMQGGSRRKTPYARLG